MIQKTHMLAVALAAMVLMPPVSYASKTDDAAREKVLADAPALTSSEDPVVTLGDLRDVGLCINQIQQQAKNIYMEVTRMPVPASAEPHIHDLKLITSGKLKKSDRYLPVRPEWIVYYIGTMEPILHLFQENIKNTRSGASKMLVPKGTKDKFEDMVEKFDNSVKLLNGQVTVIFENAGKKNSNIKIARAAVKLYEETEKIEKVRKKAFKLIKKAKKNGELEEAHPSSNRKSSKS